LKFICRTDLQTDGLQGVRNRGENGIIVPELHSAPDRSTGHKSCHSGFFGLTGKEDGQLLIVADKNIPLLDETFGCHGDLHLRSGRAMDRSDLEGADALLVKSITPVTRDLLAETAVRFVGSATIGFDHIDTQWLDEHGVTWTNAPGCNADAAAQYTLAMILLACERLGKDLQGLTAGVIGRGNVGSRVQSLLGALGVPTVACDPPLADEGVAGLVSHEKALAQDVVCLHVPLTREGPYPTWRMVNRQALARMRDGALLLNSSRGHVVDGEALKCELRTGRVHAALDVWPGEPDIDPELLAASTVATPHVAGYSEEGRRNGALMIFKEFCRWAGVSAEFSTGIEPAGRELLLQPGYPLSSAILTVSHVAEDDRAMRKLAALDTQDRKIHFDLLRRDYPLRNDFSAWRISGAGADDRESLRALGFIVT
jgi:erythronate-4-phosphate dehydrogenase